MPKLPLEGTLELKLLDKMPDNEYSATGHFRFSAGQIPYSLAHSAEQSVNQQKATFGTFISNIKEWKQV